MRVVFVASEAIPYAKTGGLADVVGTLPLHLKKIGIETTVIIPRYKTIQGSLVEEFQIEMGKTFNVRVYKNKDFIFIDYPEFFERDGIYGTKKGDFPDNCERFTLFCKAVTHLLKNGDYDIVHCHDWQSGLIPLYIKLQGIKSKTVFTIHNLGYQGRFPGSKFSILGIPDSYFRPQGIEFHGDINFLQTGILFSDILTTVSENYSREIQKPELGFQLDGIIRDRSEHLVGIINGIDYSVWNPEVDDLIYEKYGDFVGKHKNKLHLTEECNIDEKRPLIGMVSRIAEQKGFDIVIKVFDEMIDTGFSFILLGSGDVHYYEKLKKFESIYPDKVSVNIKFDEKLAHRIYAGSDFFLMPSRYEPCGLGQLISLKYGTVPIVHKTGGLADTVQEFVPEALTGNGFLFNKYSSREFLDALDRAYKAYIDQDSFKILSQNCMNYNYSWEESAKKYRKLYESF
jgi:starch synthase